MDQPGQRWHPGPGAWYRTTGIRHNGTQAKGPGREFFSDKLGARILLRGLTLGWLSYFMFDFALDSGAGLAYAETLAFSTLVFSQLWHVFDARTFSTIYGVNPFTNRYLLLAVGVSALLSIAVIYLPIGNLVFGTVPLTALHLLMVIAIAALTTFVLSAIKATFGFRIL